MPFTLSFDVASPQGLADLDAFLRGRSYVVGYTPSASDAELYAALGKAPDAKYVNVARFYSHVGSFTADARKAWASAFGGKVAAAPAAGGAGKGKKEEKKAAPAAAPAAEEEDDAADLFGDDDDDAAAKKIAANAAASKKEEKEKKPVKPGDIAKTSVIYEVKPMEAGQDMALLESKIREIEMDGLLWGGEFKVVDVAFGIQKLVVQGIVEDEKVGLDDLEEKMKAIKDETKPEEDQALCQSIDMISMNKVAGR